MLGADDTVGAEESVGLTDGAFEVVGTDEAEGELLGALLCVGIELGRPDSSDGDSESSGVGALERVGATVGTKDAVTVSEGMEDDEGPAVTVGAKLTLDSSDGNTEVSPREGNVEDG